MEASSTPPEVLLVVETAVSEDGAGRIKRRLENLNYHVTLKTDRELEEEKGRNLSDLLHRVVLVVITSPIESKIVKTTFRDVSIPVVVAESALFTNMGMTAGARGQDFGLAEHQTEVVIDSYQSHPIASGRFDHVKICQREGLLAWGKPRKAGSLIAALTDNPERAAIFAYEEGDQMYGLTAPARRVGIFLTQQLASIMDDGDVGWGFFDASVEWAASQGPDQLSCVLWRERKEIQLRRDRQRYSSSVDIASSSPPADLVGLALSGGGIRSATFSLGFLQGLQRVGLLRIFDYVSTVSGGGYAGGWWSAWLGRKPHFTESDVVDVYGFIEKLRRGEDSLSQYLWANHFYHTTQLWPEGAPCPDESALKKAIVRDLNTLIRDGEKFHWKEYLSEDRISKRARELMSQKPHGNRLAWLKRLLLESAYPENFPQNLPRSIFPPPERVVPQQILDLREALQAQPNFNEEKAPDVRSAGHDPVHYLRLFANFLTPRKGVLSADTWRAITFVSRNLILTWLILVPILISAILLGQLYFLFQPAGPEPGALNDFLVNLKPSREALLSRLVFAVWPLLVLAVWMAVLTILWLYYSAGIESEADNRWFIRQWLAIAFGIVAALFIIGLLGWFALSLQERTGGGAWEFISAQYDWNYMLKFWGIVCVIGLVVLLVCARRQPINIPKGDTAKLRRLRKRRIRRSQIERFQSNLLVIFVVVAAILLFAGFGHELVTYMLHQSHDSWFAKAMVNGGGWGALLASLGGSIFTAVKGSPVGGGDTRASGAPSWFSRLVFAVTPPLVLVVLAVLATWVTRSLLGCIFGKLNSAHGVGDYYLGRTISELRAATCVGITISFFFALIETKWRREWLFYVLFALLIAINFPLLLALRPQIWPRWVQAFTEQARIDILFVFGAALLIVAGSLLLLRLAGAERRKLDLRFWPISIAITLATGVVWLTWEANHAQTGCFNNPQCLDDQSYGWLIIFVIGGLALCLVLAILELVEGLGDNRRSLWLLVGVFLALAALMLIFIGSALPDWYRDQRMRVVMVRAVFELIGTALSWVVALGWMVNPNALSMHSFYKERLVCAYLGASNRQRRHESKLVTEAVVGDDMPLKDLENCERGAPYHLINATLNLVGGRDLTTAQRSAAAFVLSKHYCGSSRTGYRETREYMNGQLSLGAAVAISGAAASPNMGSKTPSAALSMLMTLLNVRLGYWAPTPNKTHWRSPQARLWPFYTLREFLSQTNDLSSYCYLTDGAHFDNTGLYSLIERGCRYLVAVDSGADPGPCFEDLGNVIRRCRIDFGTEIKLDISPLLRVRDGNDHDRYKSSHFIVGTITYSVPHAKSLGWADLGDQSRTGVIILFKPAVLNDESADIRQYRLENTKFPQQTTADQWYDETQFESYRRLGQFCAESAFNHSEVDQDRLDCRRAISKLSQGVDFDRQDVEDFFRGL